MAIHERTASLFGPRFLTHASYLEEKCELQSIAKIEDSDLSSVDKRLAECLSLLYQQACCAWGCHGKEHAIEYAGGRIVTHAMASYRLALRGLYDESLSLIRNIAEIANLVALFSQEEGTIREWIDCSEGERRKEFSPVKVRIRLEAGNNLIAVDQGHYTRLCESYVHFGPSTLPGSHNEPGVPVLGGLIQERGLLLSLTQLAWMVATGSGSIGKLALIPETEAKELTDASILLLKSIPLDCFTI